MKKEKRSVQKEVDPNREYSDRLGILTQDLRYLYSISNGGLPLKYLDESFLKDSLYKIAKRVHDLCRFVARVKFEKMPKDEVREFILKMRVPWMAPPEVAGKVCFAKKGTPREMLSVFDPRNRNWDKEGVYSVKKELRSKM